jgi:FkbM family methyltransferase
MIGSAGCDWRARVALGSVAALVAFLAIAPQASTLSSSAGVKVLQPPHAAVAAAAAASAAAAAAAAAAQLDCGAVAVPEDADCFFTDCADGACTDVCIKPSPSYGDYKAAIRRDYAWAFAYWRSGGPAAALPASSRAFFLDIGANIGVTLVGAARAGRRVLAFEPAPVNLRYLNATVCLNGFEQLVEVVPAAVGAVSGAVRFAEHPTRGDNSAMSAATAGLNIGGETREVEVRMWAIDDFVARNPRWAAADCVLVKVDVQGFELRVLEGARGFLRAAAAANAAFTVRAEVDDRLETSALGAAGGAARLMDELGFEVFERSQGDVLWRPRRAASA